MFRPPYLADKKLAEMDHTFIIEDTGATDPLVSQCTHNDPFHGQPLSSLPVLRVYSSNLFRYSQTMLSASSSITIIIKRYS